MNKIKALLVEKNMTVQELAEKANVKRRTLDPYMSQKAKWENARGDLLLKVADALDIDPHVLVDDEIKLNITASYQKQEPKEGE